MINLLISNGRFNLVSKYAIEISITKIKENKFISSLSFKSNQSTFLELKELIVEREIKTRIRRILRINLL